MSLLKGRDWRRDYPTAGRVRMLRERIDHVIDAVKAEQAGTARMLDGWQDHIDLAGIPSGVLRTAQKLVKLAQSNLSQSPPDRETALQRLDEARKQFDV